MSNDPYAEYDDQLGEPLPAPQPIAESDLAQPQSYGTQKPADYAPSPSPVQPHSSPYGTPPVEYNVPTNGYGMPLQPSPMVNPGIQPYYGMQPPARQQVPPNLGVNVWLSAFIPIVGIFFYFSDRGKDPLYDKILQGNLNMSLTRIGISAAFYLAAIDILPGFIGGMTIMGSMLIGTLYFIFALIGASGAKTSYLLGKENNFIGAIPFVRK